MRLAAYYPATLFYAQMFLTPDALFVLVVDMFAYSAKHSREDALDQWLDILQSRVTCVVQKAKLHFLDK